jgi:adenylyl-sulfate kinase
VNNLSPFTGKVTLLQRQQQLHQKPLVLWMTGLSGAGKTTIAIELEKKLFGENYKTVLLDGDNIRSGLNSNLSFSETDRTENIRRIAEVAKLFAGNGIIVIAGFISPLESMRKMAKDIIGNDYADVFVSCPMEVCEQRDVKGLYRKARLGELKDFTGVDAGYESPVDPSLVVETDKYSIVECVERIYRFMLPKIKYS